MIKKGVILAGGKGTRLHPITMVTNKHLLPIYNKPMIYYPIQTLVGAGVNDILIVTGPEHSGHFLNLLAHDKQFGAKFSFAVQREHGGIAQALALAEDFFGKDRVVAILGDNLYEDSFKGAVRGFLKQKNGAKVFLKEVADSNRFGVAEIKGNKIMKIEEKPKRPKSNFAVTGFYMYDNSVFDIINRLKPSARGELEITDVNNAYIKKGQMTYEVVKGSWTDAGTFESFLQATNLAAKKLQTNFS